MGEDLVLVAGQQDRMLRGADVWAHPVAYDKLGVRYRRWRNSLASPDPQVRAARAPVPGTEPCAVRAVSASMGARMASLRCRAARGAQQLGVTPQQQAGVSTLLVDVLAHHTVEPAAARHEKELFCCVLQERAEIESELRPMSAGELFSIPKEGCELGDGCDVGDLLSA